MPNLITGTATTTIDGEAYQENVTVSADAELTATPSVPAAKTGALTTRTNTTDGTLTMDSGHGITTGARVSIFWTGGSRSNVLVGTVSTNSVPISGGSGDNLPTAATAVTVQVPTSVAFSVVGDNVKSLGSHCPASGTVEYMNGSTVLLTHKIMPNTGGGKVWTAGVTHTGSNPLASATVTAVRFAHDNANEAMVMRAAVAY
jgi:hypothetical protein